MEKIYHRVNKRNQPGDAAVSLAYLGLLEELYQEFYDLFNGPKLKVVNAQNRTDMVLKEIVNFLSAL